MFLVSTADRLAGRSSLRVSQGGGVVDIMGRPSLAISSDMWDCVMRTAVMVMVMTYGLDLT